MSGSTFGTVFKIMTWGESHGKALGAVIDGCPAGIALSEDDIDAWLVRRKPGQNKYGTARKEDDKIEILSGVFCGKTTGTPISLIVYNKDQNSKDYAELGEILRPAHADYTYNAKYGIRDYRGGGRSSGRETVGRVAAGAVAGKVLVDLGVNITAYVKSIGDISVDMQKFDADEIRNNPLSMPDKDSSIRAREFLDKCIENGDSAGGIIECVIDGLIPGIGEPVFDKLDANIAKAIMSIGAVKGIEFGNGFNATRLMGSENNDCFIAEDQNISKLTNNAGGVLGGISDGSALVFRAAIKPTPSISIKQKTVTKDGQNTELVIKGRHDPIIAPRAVVVVEAMAALAVLDLVMIGKSSRHIL